MTKIQSRNNLTQSTNLEDSEIELFNAIIEYFHSKKMQVSEPCTFSGCYDRDEPKNDEYEWFVTDTHTYIGSLLFRRINRHSLRLFYWVSNNNLRCDPAVLQRNEELRLISLRSMPIVNPNSDRTISLSIQSVTDSESSASNLFPVSNQFKSGADYIDLHLFFVFK